MDKALSKTLITGANGMVGSYVNFGVPTGRDELDITDLKSVYAAFEKYKPEVVIHLAAETDVDKCERDPDHAYRVNSIGTYNVALAAKRHDALMVYVSTAAVFDGFKKGPYEVTDKENPQHYYGQSKYLGELIVRGMSTKHLIVRAGWIFGGGPSHDKKFVGKIMKLMENQEIKAVNDKLGSPTYAKDLIASIRTLITSGEHGTYHLANLGTCSRYEIAVHMKNILKKDCIVTPVPSSFFSLDAERGASEGLHSDERLMRPWREALTEYLETEWGATAGYSERRTCRVCDSSALRLVLDLGVSPLANSFLTEQELNAPERRFPLRLVFCDSCSLVQLPDVIDPRLLFLHYDYLTSASAPLVQHFEIMGDMMVDRFSLTKNDLVVEVGSNDGALLAHIKDKVRVLGVDPAEEAADLAKKKGVQTVTEFLDSSVAATIVSEYGEARIVVANNVMAHMDNVRDTFSSVRKLLVQNGHFIFEVHWVGNLIGDGGFDQIYHEHFCYYSLHSLKELLSRTGFSLEDAELVSSHGTSLRVYARNGDIGLTDRAKKLLEREDKEGLNTFEAYRHFAERVGKVKKHLKGVLSNFKKQGASVAGYGAPAKGNTLLNYCEIGIDLIPYISDSTAFKQGKYTPGTHIPIVDPSVLQSKRPDYILLLAWNYADAIMKKEAALIREGTKIILPVPRVRII